MRVTVAAAAYEMSWLDSWAGYAAKIEMWVAEAAQAGAQLLVFPEYGAMELSTLAGREVAMDLERSLHAVAEHVPDPLSGLVWTALALPGTVVLGLLSLMGLVTSRDRTDRLVAGILVALDTIAIVSINSLLS